ncbi:inositol monophosphatase [Tessaracoccus sp. MC1865]|uniref:inositol monophosphatase family protein n=1 Tax=Tessaracoccus sp. MC1865 TaxID=2760310 RepID=UPI0016007A8A|nr:inositol monophosphatase [Tessaracoccus sp. MC1865]MBB1484786.1 inositol monophosphatase [Tessaracoccus sp. MC1865]QTO36278.1 inositol monophosphatase [Tessaracoccus sp. MC1865]
MDTEGILGLLKETAAEIITPRFRLLADTDVDEKKPGDLVTVADHESEVYLTRRLKEAFPNAVVVGEEAVFADPSLLKGLGNADHAFIIDPIDGTRNFVHGRDEHGVILAEVRGGVTTRGWIWQPQTGRAYVAERGAGVQLNGGPIERRRHDRPPLGASSKRKLRGFDADGKLSPVVRSHFACCFDYPAVLDGTFDFMFYSSLHPWDHLAGSLMVVENGGISRTIDGMDYSLTSRSRGGLLVAGDTLSWMVAQQNWPII